MEQNGELVPPSIVRFMKMLLNGAERKELDLSAHQGDWRTMLEYMGAAPKHLRGNLLPAMLKGRSCSLEILDMILGPDEEEPEAAGPVEERAAEVPPSDHEEDGQLNRAKALLLKLLNDSPMAAKEIEREFELAGISKRTAQRAKDSLNVGSIKGKDGWSWTLK